MPKPKVKRLYPCEKCGTALSSAYNLKIHIETRCSTEKNFVCEVCDSRFLTQHSLRTHLNSLHYGEKKFVCGFCGNKYLSKGQLKVHERSHTKEKSFVCQECGKGFSHRESLVTHTTLHTGIKPYCCECCSATFSCVGNLIKHRKVRSTTCGLPKYTNKKISKRAGVKLEKKPAEVQSAEEPETQDDAEMAPVYFIDEKLEATEVTCVSEVETSSFDTSQTHIADHQYVSPDLHQSTQLEDYSRKEIDVFDYIGIEIKNIQEQEEREKLLQLQTGGEDINSESAAEEFISPEAVDPLIADDHQAEEFIIEEIAEDSFVEQDDEPETITIERVDEIKTEQFEVNLFIDVVVENGVSSRFQCKMCPKVYRTMNITAMHLKSEHNIKLENYNYDKYNRYRRPQKDPKFKCSYCPKFYTSKKFVDRHEILHGPDGTLVHKCSCCSLYFETEDKMEEHQHLEHDDKLICKECGKRFDHPEKLVGHVRYAHSKKAVIKKYLFVCELCGRNFNTKVALSDHERSNCGKAPIYQCPHCSKNYHSAGSLKCHMTIHTNSLEFGCTFCEKRFRTKGQLTVHLRSHTKEKNYKCSYCPAEFSHRESLLTHNTLHTGIKRFECSSCHSRFSCISNLLAHRKSHKDQCGSSTTNKVSEADNRVKMCRNQSILGM